MTSASFLRPWDQAGLQYQWAKPLRPWFCDFGVLFLPPLQSNVLLGEQKEIWIFEDLWLDFWLVYSVIFGFCLCIFIICCFILISLDISCSTWVLRPWGEVRQESTTSLSSYEQRWNFANFIGSTDRPSPQKEPPFEKWTYQNFGLTVVHGSRSFNMLHVHHKGMGIQLRMRDFLNFGVKQSIANCQVVPTHIRHDCLIWTHSSTKTCQKRSKFV